MLPFDSRLAAFQEWQLEQTCEESCDRVGSVSGAVANESDHIGRRRRACGGYAGARRASLGRASAPPMPLGQFSGVPMGEGLGAFGSASLPDSLSRSLRLLLFLLLWVAWRVGMPPCRSAAPVDSCGDGQATAVLEVGVLVMRAFRTVPRAASVAASGVVEGALVFNSCNGRAAAAGIDLVGMVCARLFRSLALARPVPGSAVVPSRVP